jgi:hypothetical protein
MGGACYPVGYDPEGGSSLMCGARSPGPLGLRDAADPDATAVMGRSPGPMGLNDAAACMADAGTSTAPPNVSSLFGPVVEDEPNADQAFLIVEVETKDPAVKSDTWLDTTAENLWKFAYDKRTDWPGGLLDLKTVAERLREFGGAKFYVMAGKGKGKEGQRYLVFKGNPRKPGKIMGVREMIRGNGPYSFKNPKIVQMGFATKEMLKGGAKATVISFVVVAGINVVDELLKDEFSMRRLGVQLALDAVNLLITGLAAVGVSAGIVALSGAAIVAGLTAPVWLVFVGGLAAGLIVGGLLDMADEQFGISDAIHKKAEEMQNRFDLGISRFFAQMRWCAMNPYRCF